MVILDFIRHAESEYNAAGLFCGNVDCNATTEALEKAKQLSSQFGSYDFLYSSPLKRAIQTASVLKPNMHCIIDSRIAEASLGDWEHKHKSSVPAELLFLFRTNIYLPPNAEPLEEIEQRVFSFLKEMFDRYQHDEKILIITHNAILRSIKRMFPPINNITNNYFQNLELLTLSSEVFFKTIKEEIK